MQIPQDMHDHVLAVATGLANASTLGDTRTRWRLHGELHDYCVAMAEAGRDHPFLWETLADFTSDDTVALGFYEHALEQAQALGMVEAQASIHLELARRHVNLGQPGPAYESALRADQAARLTDDLDLRREISQFLLENAADG